ncbi:hypothetical protein GCM10010124_28790 [Pilimelia terevasa]|uniref:DUF6879 domain-containing protein n=1 Tax=Pilimelia terevasa TaxID=53372 RepID=A0A8J3BSK9_9ACTN|nr:DUF6879 family protein [Pilimelia terevasa]GGK34427.1 hypothetical protein GCM10010124_28790 [Pilimelia terevasa]
MREITYEEFRARYLGIAESWMHMELRDSYLTVDEKPDFMRWQTTGTDDNGWMRPWLDNVRRLADEGKNLRRLKVVSTPVSEYHRWVHAGVPEIIAHGEETRWCDRKRVSHLAFPGNDFYVLDRKSVMFLHFAGDGPLNLFTVTEAPHVVQLCLSAFESCWRLSTAHGDFRI